MQKLSPTFKTWQILITSISFLLTACNPKAISTPTLIYTPEATSTTPSTSIPTQETVVLQAIPTKDFNNQDDLEKIIFEVFGGKPECYHSVLKFENERKEAGNPVFTEQDTGFDPVFPWKKIIAENENRTVQTFVSWAPINSNGTGGADHLIVKDMRQNKIYDVNFYTQSSNRAIDLNIWIGNDIFTFSQNNSPATTTIAAINVQTQNYMFLSLYFHGCE